MVESLNLCPVCGFELNCPPWVNLRPSHNICPCCFIEFGFDDVTSAGGLKGTPDEIHVFWRDQWIKKGFPWISHSQLKPEDWDPIKQLRNIGIVLPKKP